MDRRMIIFYHDEPTTGAIWIGPQVRAAEILLDLRAKFQLDETQVDLYDADGYERNYVLRVEDAIRDTLENSRIDDLVYRLASRADHVAHQSDAELPVMQNDGGGDWSDILNSWAELARRLGNTSKKPERDLAPMFPDVDRSPPGRKLRVRLDTSALKPWERKKLKTI